MKWPRWPNAAPAAQSPGRYRQAPWRDRDPLAGPAQQAAQLGWPDEDEAGLAERACRGAHQAALAGLARRWPLLAAAVRRAFGPGGARRRDSDTKAGLPRSKRSNARRPADALAAAQALGDIDEQLGALRRAEQRAAASSMLPGRCSAPWELAPEAAGVGAAGGREMAPAVPARVPGPGFDANRGRRRLESLDAELAEAVLAERQLRAVVKPVTGEELADARTLRDRSWVAIGTANDRCRRGASGFER